MKQEMTKKQMWLRRTGLIICIVGLVVFFIFGLFGNEGGPSVYAILPITVVTLLYGIPLFIGLFISWKWSFGGGITLLVLATCWLGISFYKYLSTPAVNPVSELVWYAIKMFALIGLPYLVSGIFFVLAAKRPA